VNVLVAIHSPVLAWNIPSSHIERLRRDFPHHTFLHALDDSQAVRLIADAQIAFSSQVDVDQWRAARVLQWIHSPAAGVGSMLFPEMVDSPVVITNSRGMSADTIAEHVIAVTLALFRRLPLAVRRQAERQWAQDEIGGPPSNRLVAGARILIVGLGAIGRAAAARFTALGAPVTGIRRTVGARTAADGESGVPVAGPERLHELLPQADVVVIAAPQTATTRHLIDRAALDRMNQNAIVVNVSRGKLVDERALAAALRDGRIAGAALDVFEHEPLTRESPLWAMPNVLITPHTSGFRPDHWDAAVALFTDNMRRFERGDPLMNVVDKRAGY
jgi:phosphoglycerate dehydrogenase-like enzyme